MAQLYAKSDDNQTVQIEPRFQSLWLVPLFFVALVCSCSSDSTSPIAEDDDDDAPVVATSESELSALPPIVLVDPIGADGTISESTLVLSGKIVSSNEIVGFTYSLGANPASDILTALDSENIFAVSIADLQEGENAISFLVTDAAGETTTLDLVVAYTPGFEEEIPDATETWEHVAEILSTLSSDWQNFINLLEALQGNAEAAKDFLDFFSDWDGETESLQAWWNEWANANGTFPGIIPLDPHNESSDKENLWTMSGIRFTINDIAHLSDLVFDNLTGALSNFQSTEDATIMKNSKEVLGCDFEWTLTMTGFNANLGLSADKIKSIQFLDNTRLEVEINLDDAVLDTNVRLTGKPADACVLFNKNKTRDGSMRAQKISGTLILELEFDQTTQTLQVAGLDDSSFLKAESVSAEMEPADSLWQQILDALFKLMHNKWSDGLTADENAFVYLFDIDCDENCDPYKTMFNESLSKDKTVQNRLVTELNTFLTAPFGLAGSVSIGANAWQYSAFLNTIQTSASPDRLISDWTINVDSTGMQDSCARQFKIPENFGPPSDPPTLADMTLQLPYSAIAQTLLGLARDGVFCASQEIQVGDFVIANLDLRPYGTIAITPSETDSAHLDVSYPFRIALNWGDSNARIRHSSQNNLIFGTLVMSVRFATNCDSGLTFSIEKAKLQDLSGNLKINTYTVGLESFEASLQTAIESLNLTDIQNVSVMDNVIDLENLPGLAVQMDNEFVVEAADINFGLNLVDESTCQ